MQPLQNRVIVRLVEQTKETEGGILIPDSAVEKPNKGTVVAVGPDVNKREQPVESVVLIGDTVLFSKYAGNEFEYEGEKLTILVVDDILVKL